MKVTSIHSSAPSVEVNLSQASLAAELTFTPGDAERPRLARGRVRQRPFSAAIDLHAPERVEPRQHETAPRVPEAADEMLSKRSGETVVDDGVAAEMDDADGLSAPSGAERSKRGVIVFKSLRGGKRRGGGRRPAFACADRRPSRARPLATFSWPQRS